MKKIMLYSGLLLFLFCHALSIGAREFHIIPQPVSIVESKGEFLIDGSVSFYAQGEGAASVAQLIASKIARSTGWVLPVVQKKKDKCIVLKIDKRSKGGPEAYTLTVRPEGVVATASAPQGLFYAMQTFLQLLPPQIESPSVVKGVNWVAPSVTVQDKPRFSYRGAMIDVCRHFFPVEMIKHQIDVLSMYKINTIHWHLTEDQGWRMESRKYPELNKKGAWRTDATGKAFGGYYTIEEMKEVVRYAAEHFITVIPELEIPGHELAAIAAYPWLSCRNVDITPRLIWGIEDVVMCPGKESTFRFLEDIVDEMLDIFPSPYYHIGGDESPRVEWEKCPLCQKRADELGLKKEEGRSREAQLQSYVVNRMEKYLNSKGKSIIGWDEILEGGNLNPSAVVMSWRGEKGGIAASKAGHKVIMTPGSKGYYTDHFQGDPAIEPYGIGKYSPLEKTYNYDPVPEEVEKAGKAHLVWGAQCNTWTEYIASAAKFDYRLYPRGLAVAETGWSPRSAKSFTDFCRRLDDDASVRMHLHGVNFHIPLPEQPGGSMDYIAFTDKTKAVFQTTRPEKMVYTTDGTEPHAGSAIYENPLEIKENTVLKIRTVLPCGLMSAVRTVTYTKQPLSPAIDVKPEKKGLNLRTVPGVYTSLEQLSSIHFWNKGNVLTDLKDICRQVTIPRNGRNVEHYAAVAEGMILIPEDGVYCFRGNYPLMEIDGQAVVNNDGFPSNHHMSGTRSMALKAGWHRLSLVYMSYIVDGTSSWIGERRCFYRKGFQGDYKVIEPDMLGR